MEQLKIFENPEFGQVRTREVNGKPYFCASDIAKALGYKNTVDAISKHCRAIVKCDTPISGKIQSINYIPEGDIYRLIVHSKLPSAEKFERWVFDEVLPSIRKHGAYMTEDTLQKALTSPDFLIQLATKLKEEQEKNKALTEKNAKQAERIEDMRPKEIFADAVTTSQSSILIGELAKLISQNGYNIGQNRLFTWLRDNGFLIKRKGTDYNMPTQKSVDMNLFEIKESTSVNSDGRIRLNKTPKVTGKGQIYFINKFVLGKPDDGQMSLDI